MSLEGFQLPENIRFEDDTLTETYGKLIAEPLERGFGVTIGNSLRRVLLSSIESAAVTSVKIEGVPHEFSSLQGVKEDVVQIVLNLKKIRFKLSDVSETMACIDVIGKTEVIAGDIIGNNLEVMNPDFHIATIDENVNFKADLHINKGRGYVPTEDMSKEDLPIGTILIDAIYTPVKKVNFVIEKTRVGKITDYDKLIMEIWTDGTITPVHAINNASRTIIEHLRYFLLTTDIKQIDLEQIVVHKETEVVESPRPIVMEDRSEGEFNPNLLKSVDEIELTVRSHNCLKNADIKYIYELVQKTEYEMLKTKNFGRKSLNELKEILKFMGLDFNTKVDMDIVKRHFEAREHALKDGG
ncbi:MAG: DNA-directed RNA polymerase subunit alpha [Nitrospirae bacterium]|nr:DNA-directed RNA polymerase subunit alpha [Nitrospirota bacterium]